MTDLAKATTQQLRDAIEDQGLAVIIWSPEDFPSQDAFDRNVGYVVDICIERGNEFISNLRDDA